ncbi:MAG: prepilin peptidase [archaeon]|nr:MAG: prepilin peptidase [archaeon]
MEVILGYFLITISLAGSGLSGYIDLRTTEIPDEIPLAMVLLGLLIRFSYSLFSGDWGFLLFPAIIGGGFFLFGMMMYYTGQWGGGDAKVLGAIGVLIGTLPAGLFPLSVFPLFLSLIVNVFLVGAVYIIIYAIVMSFLNKKIASNFFKSLKGSSTEFAIIVSAISFFIVANVLVFWNLFGLLNLWLIFGAAAGGIGFYLLWKFLKSVENVGFMKKIKTARLREGDMLGEDIKKLNLNKKIIRGLTKEEVGKIRKLKKTVWIREGVRFAPVFPISIAVTLLFDNLLIFIL